MTCEINREKIYSFDRILSLWFPNTTKFIFPDATNTRRAKISHIFGLFVINGKALDSFGPFDAILTRLSLCYSADEMIQEFEKIRVLVSYNGLVHWEPGGVFTTTCDIDITYFPFDKQVTRVIASPKNKHNVNGLNITLGRTNLTFRISKVKL